MMRLLYPPNSVVQPFSRSPFLRNARPRINVGRVCERAAIAIRVFRNPRVFKSPQGER
jgi:hypothetical protein